MLLHKETGGCSIAWRGKNYKWKTDGAAIQVPDELGRELLAIAGGGFSEPVPEPAAPVPDGGDGDGSGEGAAGSEGDGEKPVTEPGPEDDASKVTEPAPADPAAVTEQADGAKGKTPAR